MWWWTDFRFKWIHFDKFAWPVIVFIVRRPLNEHKIYAKIPIMTDDVWQSVNWVRWMDQILFRCSTDRVAIFIVSKRAKRKSAPVKFMVETNWWAATITTRHISLRACISNKVRLIRWKRNHFCITEHLCCVRNTQNPLYRKSSWFGRYMHKSMAVSLCIGLFAVVQC